MLIFETRDHGQETVTKTHRRQTLKNNAVKF
jgi:hypothetical protein